jgi:hypothetical protein
MAGMLEPLYMFTKGQKKDNKCSSIWEIMMLWIKSLSGKDTSEDCKIEAVNVAS